MPPNTPVVPVILAAGRGTRMRSALPKVLQPLAEKPLILHVLDCVESLDIATPVVVVGHGADRVRGVLPPTCCIVHQGPQLGTGHALQCALPKIDDQATVLVLYGDVPLIRPETLQALLDTCPANGLAILTTHLTEPFGYGRILRNEFGSIVGIVEERDADVAQKALREVNTGIMVASSHLWARWLACIDNKNEQGEYYLTDCISLAAAEGIPIIAHRSSEAEEVTGVNDRIQLATAEEVLRSRRAIELMKQGALLRDPSHIEIRGHVRVGYDVEIDTGVVFEGDVSLGDGVRIGPFSTLRNCTLGDRVDVLSHCVVDGAQVAPGSRIGPFARLRPGTQLGEKTHIGNFVEIKNSEVGEGSKINHLSYVGDTAVGRYVNLGAGSITANYDGVNKHRTEICDRASVGSNTVLVAPVTVGKNATIGAGSVITADAPENKLTLARARQISIEGWQRPKSKD